MHNHERLLVWQRAHELSVAVCRATARDRGRGVRTAVAQFERAVTSIPANIAEGAGQSTDAQFARFLDIAAGSSQEALSHLRLIADIGLLPSGDHAEWREELVAIRRMLAALARRFRGAAVPR